MYVVRAEISIPFIIRSSFNSIHSIQVVDHERLQYVWWIDGDSWGSSLLPFRLQSIQNLKHEPLRGDFGLRFFGGCASGIDALVWKYWSKKGLGIWLSFYGCENGERKGFDGQVPRGSSIRCLEEQLWRGTHLTWLGCFSSKPHPVPFLACRESRDSPSICSFLLCKQTMVVHAGKDGKSLRITYSAFNSSTHNLHTHSHWNCKFRV